MGREVRMVPANWNHPKYDTNSAPYPNRVGKHIPLFKGSYAEAAADWDEARTKWEEGLVRDYANGGWKPKSEDHIGRYTEWEGARPSPDDYMPDWSEDQRTHHMMYETTSEGTPISPSFTTPEKLARWLADNKASAFGSQTASYESWLYVANGGFAPSAVMTDAGLESGVEALGGRAV
jgi:hypothetical protein